jgi:DNA repair exonuclease SbcCD ATPase subunit
VAPPTGFWQYLVQSKALLYRDFNVTSNMSEIMEKKLSELTGKIKALNFAIGKSDEVIDSTKTEILTRQISSITNRIEAIQSLKEEIEEIKFTDGDSEENVRTWAEEIESKINAADEKVSEIRQRVNTIREKEKATADESERVAADIERQKQLEFERQKFELQQVAKDEEHKRELKHKTELFNQQLEYEKSVKTLPKEQETATSIKLPKLPMTEFDGNFAKWLPFWNTFKAEVDKADVPPVTKFAFLKEWLEPKFREEVEGLPFTT